MFQDKIITGFSVEDYKVVSVDFDIEGQSYVARISSEDISLYFKDDSEKKSKKIARLDLESGLSIWKLKHCCGAQGFGREIGDVCYACDFKDDEMEANPHASFAILSTSSNYSKTLDDFFTKKLIDHCSELEYLYKI